MLLAQFSVIRFIPDPVRDEPTNVGVILEGIDAPFLECRVTTSPKRLQISPWPGSNVLTSALENFQELVEELKKEPMGSRLSTLAEMCTTGLCVTEPRPCVAVDLAQKLDELFGDFVGQSPATKRQFALNLFFREVTRKGLTAHIRHDYTIRTKHDILVADAAFRCNGSIECIQGVSLPYGSGAEASLGAARVVAYMWREIQEAHEPVKKVTAVVRPPLKRVGNLTPEELLDKARGILIGHGCAVVRGDDEAEVRMFVNEVAERHVPWDEKGPLL